MPWLNKRWISFFIFSAVVGVVFVSVAGWANNREANKLKNQLSQFSFPRRRDIQPTLFFAKTHSERMPTSGPTGQTPIKYY
jgi:hypothetical protein